MSTNHHEDQYLQILRECLNHGVEYDDRTGVGRIGLWQRQMRFDLREGFPLLTTKKMAWKYVIRELLWFISGSTYEPHLSQQGCSIWRPWSDVNGDLGKIYGYRMTRVENNGPPEMVQPKETDPKYNEQWEMPIYPLEEPVNEDTQPSVGRRRKERVGDTVVSTTGREFRVLQFVGSRNAQSYYLIQSKVSGHKKEVASTNIGNGKLSDPYEPTRVGVGFIGEMPERYPVAVDNLTESMRHNLQEVWSSMIDRCYNPKCKEYPYYGKQGVYVCRRWHSFSLFLCDAVTLPNWWNKWANKQRYEIDKDHFNAMCYAPNTTVWLPASRNKLYRTSVAFKGVDPDGNAYLGLSGNSFANEHGLTASKINLCLRGKNSHHKGWTFSYLDNGHLYRFPLPINQLKNLVEGIQNNPTSTRHIMNLWSEKESFECALPHCHILFHCKVQGDTLHSAMYARSQDLCLGTPFNMASYALLTKLIAWVTGLEAGTFVHHLGDTHVYKNQVEGTKEQLSREPYSMPAVGFPQELKGSGFEGLMSVKESDIFLHGYNHHPKITFPVAV